jgi:hypothetical protein
MKIFAHKHFNLLYFSGCFIALFLIYFSAHNAMLIDDGISGIWEVKMQGIQGYWKSYGFENFYYGHYGIVALLYFLFGLHALGWYLFFVAMHALNATLLFMVCKKIFSNTNTDGQASLMAMCGSLLFLLSPYQSENIIWAATSHYCVTLFILLFSAYLLIGVMAGKTLKFFLLIHVLFGISLLTLEISFLFPFILAGIFILFKLFKRNKLANGDFLLKLLLPQIVLIFVYCLFHKLLYQTWIPHDRAGHDTIFSFPHVITTLSQQMLKLFGFVHFLEYGYRETIYHSLLHWKKVLLALSIIFIALSFFLYKKGKPQLYTGLFFIIAALLMYAPFMRLYFMFLARIENDRYNYFASVFLFSLLVFVLFQLPRFIRITLIAGYLIAFVVCLFPVVSARKHSAVLHREYLSQLNADTVRGKIFLLNVPASCKDAYMFRAEGRLGIAYQTIYDKDIFDKIVQVAWYNAQSEKDHFEVIKLSDSSYQVQIKTPGSWWMYQSIGASDMEHELYSFKLNEWGDYILTFKNKPDHADQILLYDQGRFLKIN